VTKKFNIDRPASSGDQINYRKYVSFALLPLEAALSIPNVSQSDIHRQNSRIKIQSHLLKMIFEEMKLIKIYGIALMQIYKTFQIFLP
jgi:hypothetical protein